MHINKAEYVTSAPDITSCPEDDRTEICFAGRSNVGKSSLINALTRRKNLARTSNTPGKTRLLNYYLIDELWYLVDMPGYGYARISKKEQARWGKAMKDYLLKRDTLSLVVVLVDIRREPSALDEEFLFFLGEQRIPFCLVLNKADKISASMASRHKIAAEKLLMEMNIEVPVFRVSSIHPDSLNDFQQFLLERVTI